MKKITAERDLYKTFNVQKPAKTQYSPGYYFYDTAERSVYTEGGHYDTLEEISNVNTDTFYEEGGEDTLGIYYVDEQQNGYIYDPLTKQYHRVATDA